ncbi:MAG: hypothetical protein AAFS10_15780 [Myxococcota bacterium]
MNVSTYLKLWLIVAALMVGLAYGCDSEEEDTSSSATETADTGGDASTQDVGIDTHEMAEMDTSPPEPDIRIEEDSTTVVEDSAMALDVEGDTADVQDDTEAMTDTTRDDTSPDDTSPDAVSTGVPLEGFGDISGACGVLDAALLDDAAPRLVRTTIDFADDPYDDADLRLLSEGGQKVVEDDNAGGSSLLSEAFAFEVLYRCELATLLKTETEIVYDDPMGRITDLLVEIDGFKIGVSVTRAVTFPRTMEYMEEQAQSLLEGKLAGVLESSANVSDEDAWVRQILHIIADTPEHAQVVEGVYPQIDAELRADTLVFITVSEGSDDFLY